MTEMKSMIIHDAKLKYNGRNGLKSWRNFEGAPGPCNSQGNRFFTIVPSDEEARQMKDAGWPVKWIQKYNADEGVMEPIVTVTVKYRTRDGRPMTPPKVVVISGKKTTEYGEKEVHMLDDADFEKVNIKISYYESKNPRTGEMTPKVGLDVLHAYLRRDELTEELEKELSDEDAPF